MLSRTLCTLLFLLITCCIAFSQVVPVRDLVDGEKKAGRPFTSFSLFKASTRPDGVVSQPATKATYLQLDRQVLADILSYKPSTLTLPIPYQGSILLVELVQQNVLSSAFTVITSGKPGKTEPYEPGVYYRGIVQGITPSLAAVSFFKDDVMGVISLPTDGNLNLGKLDLPKNRTDYVLFSDKDFTGTIPTGCSVTDEQTAPHPQPGVTDRTNVPGCVRVYFEADNDLYTNKGTVTATTNYITGFFNSVSTLYQNEQVGIVISQIYVWTTPDPYPITSSTDALYAFQAERTTFNGDIAHLVTLDAGGLGGVAFIDVLCSTYNYAYSDISSTYSSFPTYSWTVEVVTHEMGHSMSSHHTHWCGWTGGAIDNCYATEGGCAAGPPPSNGGTIMSYCHLTGYGINFNNGFGTQPGNAIRTGVSSASCLAASCSTNPCPPPNNFTLSGTPTGSSATFTWSAGSGNVTYNLRYRVYTATSWTTINGVTSPYTLSGLLSGQQYSAEIQAICSGGGSSDYFVGIFFKTVSNCAQPTSQSVSGITSTSATLSWVENGGATSWQIKYGAPGFDPTTGGTQVTANATSYNLTGLSVGTTYDWYVRSTCAPPNSGYSGYTGPNTFTTSLPNNNASGAILLSLNILYDENNAGATIETGEPNPSVSPGRWGNAITNTVWFKFVAPSSGCVTISTDFMPQGTNDDTQLALYQVGTVSNFSTYKLLASDDDNGVLGSTYNSTFSYSGLTAGTTYYIQADGYATNDGTFQIEITETVDLANLDNTCTAFPTLSVNGTSDPNRWWTLWTTSTGIEVGQLVGAIKTPQNLGTVTLKALGGNPGTTTPNIYYMGRYYDIQSSTPPTNPVTVRMFYKNSDLAALEALAGISGVTIADIDGLHYDGINEDCSYANNGSNTYTAITNPTAVQVGSSDVFYLQYTINSFSELLGTVNAIPFPLELISFEARADGSANRIDWQTATEQNVAWHVVERSATGTTDWTEVGRVPGQTSAKIAHSYELKDMAPLPVSYYRLNSIDQDGKHTYSPIVRVERAQSTFQIASLFPVPTHDQLKVQFNLPEEAEVVFHIRDVTGRLLREWTVESEKGLHQTAVDLQELPSGMYLLELLGKAQAASPKWFTKD
jgi:hypothetical protein